MQGKLVAENEEQVRRAKEMGHENIDQVLYLDDLVSSDDVMFVATGVTNVDVLRGIRRCGDYICTHTVVLRNRTHTIRFLETRYKAQ